MIQYCFVIEDRYHTPHDAALKIIQWNISIYRDILYMLYILYYTQYIVYYVL